MGARIKKKRKKTRKRKIAEGYLTCKSEKTPKALVEELNAMTTEKTLENGITRKNL